MAQVHHLRQRRRHLPPRFLRDPDRTNLYRTGATSNRSRRAVPVLDVQECWPSRTRTRAPRRGSAGQVDDIVQSKPEELRAYVEEAAGIAKHRRRKERALRRIDQVSMDIDRAQTWHRVRRQLRPLRAQAEQARRYSEITERLRELRIRRLVGELEGLERERARAMDGRNTASEQLEGLRSRLDSCAAAARRRPPPRCSRRASSGMRRAWSICDPRKPPHCAQR